MHNNFFFLQQVAQSLKNKLTNWILATCFSQNKDELILGFCTTDQEFYIRAMLTQEISALSFPENFQRAKRNSVELFDEILNKTVLDVIQIPNERSFYFLFEDNFALLFKMHGNRANVILFENQKVTSVFKHSLSKDLEINFAELARPLDYHDAAYFLENGQNLKKAYPTLGNVPLTYWQQHGLDLLGLVEQWPHFEEMISVLEKPSSYYVGTLNDELILSLLPIFEDGQSRKYTNPLEAANQFAAEYARLYFSENEKSDALRLLQKRKEQTTNYIQKTETKLNGLESSARYEEIGHILMANLHNIKPRTEKITLEDFYRNQPLEIKLKADLSPQRNAENYYRKAKNQKVELDKLYENLDKKQQELARIETHINFIEKANSVKEIRKYLKDNKIISDQQKEEMALPYRRFEYEGFDIWVGKNAQHNDTLTQRYSHKEDLWLHARDVSGSHVLVKYKSGKPFPKSVIEKAASLAAYYSKRKTDTLCPVICTPKKFVRKVKGAAAGSVIVDKEDVILVRPAAFDEN
ncbi:Predicted component of the ribosome quality control (RQC) complex, YloA/Tae2 family, contains fibronectin-binding (FbpA) and DUF814 domains [Flexibacter flexilis DSM 6793]|uniref:Predicted component of the ribosome quality control (RQC) complex, YloA/Tae2 family, contains fibronectin-binding (FbpA) and DUF814 domains n=1 Tax=Flexibacter flexilis DSM 6793 TaxID=927664 RepID=A0A1I1EEE8_9BACT|nr:NFACT RNA binding domain-containing protein [Flexibacter flexilis]SFB83340.1 Predicted component of the ribosome quality control (RQC) complex, YloA/Tae2 family, contains fibronectin-binding (FbpA) and DUF814 domains [Flexibacter flexilis DSM 6793]